MNLAEIFADVVDLSPEDREAWLEEHEVEEGMRQDVESLLRADEGSGFLDAGALSLPTLSSEKLEPGQVVGSYELEDEVGHGGMGTVYKARHVDIPDRVVAIKFLKPGVPSDVVWRLRQERQVLAGLEHPNIARLFDGGEIDQRPYLVMEYVEGSSLDQYCNNRELSARGRVEIFQKVCGAVHYAHRHLVVHRDLKPSNIMVTGDGEPKLLDFGIAKLLGSDATDIRVTDGAVWTPAYASPEQLRRERTTVGTDVYGLGVVFVELMSGFLPIDKGSYFELAEAIMNEEPLRPSVARVRGEAETGTIIAKGVDRIDSDLDAIALKALRKEPGNRYQSVEEFGNDLDRWLGGMPVKVRGEEVWYRAGKWIRYYWVSASVALSVFLVIAGFFGAYLREAENARQSGIRSDKAGELLVDVLSAADPRRGRKDVTVREVLEEGETKVRRELLDQPELQAPLFDAIGRIFASVGAIGRATALHADAVRISEELYGKEDQRVSVPLVNLAEAHRFERDYDKAQEYYRAALEIGFADEVDRARALRGLGLSYLVVPSEAAVRYLEDAIEIFEDAAQDRIEISLCLEGLVEVYVYRGEYAQAEEIARAMVLELGSSDEDAPDLGRMRAVLGHVLLESGKLVEAEELLSLSVASLRRAYGDGNVHLAKALYLWSMVLTAQGDVDGSKEGFLEVIAFRGVTLPSSNPIVVLSYQELGRIAENDGQSEKAIEYMTEGLTIAAESFGVRNKYGAALMNGLGRIYLGKEEWELAAIEFKKADEVMMVLYPDGHADSAFPLYGLARVQEGKGEIDEAIDLMQRVVEIMQQFLGEDHYLLVEPLLRLGSYYGQVGTVDAEGVVLQRCFAIAKVQSGGPKLDLAAEALKAYFEKIGDREGARKVLEELSRIETEKGAPTTETPFGSPQEDRDR